LEKSDSKEFSTCVSKKCSIVHRGKNLLVRHAFVTMLCVTLILVTIGKLISVMDGRYCGRHDYPLHGFLSIDVFFKPVKHNKQQKTKIHLVCDHTV